MLMSQNIALNLLLRPLTIVEILHTVLSVPKRHFLRGIMAFYVIIIDYHICRDYPPPPKKRKPYTKQQVILADW